MPSLESLASAARRSSRSCSARFRRKLLDTVITQCLPRAVVAEEKSTNNGKEISAAA
jgi:hypothetical protein